MAGDFIDASDEPEIDILAEVTSSSDQDLMTNPFLEDGNHIDGFSQVKHFEI